MFWSTLGLKQRRRGEHETLIIKSPEASRFNYLNFEQISDAFGNFWNFLCNVAPFTCLFGFARTLHRRRGNCDRNHKMLISRFNFCNACPEKRCSRESVQSL